MKQVTAKDIYTALDWIENNGHHKASWEEKLDKKSFFVLEGYGCKLRIPLTVRKLMEGLIEPAPGEFDTRMFRATTIGKRRLRYWRSRNKELLG